MRPQPKMRIPAVANPGRCNAVAECYEEPMAIVVTKLGDNKYSDEVCFGHARFYLYQITDGDQHTVGLFPLERAR